MNFFLFFLISSIYYLNVSPNSSKCYSNVIDCYRGPFLTNLTSQNCNLTEEQTCYEPGICITVVGRLDKKPVRFKGCESEYVYWEDKSICARVKEKVINISCSICDHDNCNKGGSLTCYGCDDKPRCIDSLNITCFDENFSCFLARGYDKYNQLVNERGCVPNEEIEAEYKRYKEKGFTYSVCNNSDLCNTDRTGPLLTCLGYWGEISCGGHDNFVCINTFKNFLPYRGCMMKDAAKEYCKVDNRTGDIPCYICEKDLCNVQGNLCYECSSYGGCSSPHFTNVYNCLSKDHDCFTAKGIEDEKPVMIKSCVSKNRVDFVSKLYAKRNLSLTACYGDYCNGEQNRSIECYRCYNNYDCALEETEICTADDFSCISANGFSKNGRYMVNKHCVLGVFASYECDKYKKEGLSCSVCNSDLCNLLENPTQGPNKEDNYTERMYLSESKVSSISSVILLVAMLTCIRLL